MRKLFFIFLFLVCDRLYGMENFQKKIGDAVACDDFKLLLSVLRELEKTGEHVDVTAVLGLLRERIVLLHDEVRAHYLNDVFDGAVGGCIGVFAGLLAGVVFNRGDVVVASPVIGTGLGICIAEFQHAKNLRAYKRQVVFLQAILASKKCAVNQALAEKLRAECAC